MASGPRRGEARPGGRTARTRDAVHRAVSELLAEGDGTFTVRDVSARSGVHEVTIYRRWRTVQALVLDVAVTDLNENSPFPDTGDLRRDLLDWAHSVAEQVRTRRGFALYSALAAATSPLGDPDPSTAQDAATYLRHRTDQIQAALDRHAASGAPTPTVEKIFDVVLAPVYLRAIFGYAAPALDLDALVDRALAVP